MEKVLKRKTERYIRIPCLFSLELLHIKVSLHEHYNLLPRLPDFLRVLSVGVGVTSSVGVAKERKKKDKAKKAKVRKSVPSFVSTQDKRKRG